MVDELATPRGVIAERVSIAQDRVDLALRVGPLTSKRVRSPGGPGDELQIDRAGRAGIVGLPDAERAAD